MSLPGVKRNLVYYFILSASQVLLPLVSLPYVSRVLDPAGVGRVAFIDSLAYFFTVVAEFGIVVYATREVARIKDDAAQLNRFVEEMLFLHVIVSAVSLLIYMATVYLVYERINDPRLVWLSILFLSINAFSCEWYFLGMEKFKYISLRSIATRLAAVVCIFIFIKKSGDYYLYYTIIVLSAAAIATMNLSVLLANQKIKLKAPQWRKHLKYTWVTYLISLLTGVFIYLDNFMLGLLGSAFAVGLYAFAMRIARVSGSLITDTMQVFFPGIVSLIHSNNVERLRFTLLRSIQLISTFSVPLMAGTFLLANQVVHVVLGPGFSGSVTDLQILSCYPLLRAHNIYFSKQILIANNHEKLALRTLAIGSCCLVLLIVILAPLYADNGVSAAVVLTELLVLLLNYFYSKKTVPQWVRVDWKCFYQSLLCSLLFIPVIYFSEKIFVEHWQQLLCSILVCIAAYVLCQLYVFKNAVMVSLKDSGLKFFVRLMEGTS